MRCVEQGKMDTYLDKLINLNNLKTSDLINY